MLECAMHSQTDDLVHQLTNNGVFIDLDLDVTQMIATVEEIVKPIFDSWSR
jgi:hypothetical protein